MDYARAAHLFREAFWKDKESYDNDPENFEQGIMFYEDGIDSFESPKDFAKNCLKSPECIDYITWVDTCRHLGESWEHVWFSNYHDLSEDDELEMDEGMEHVETLLKILAEDIPLTFKVEDFL